MTKEHTVFELKIRLQTTWKEYLPAKLQVALNAGIVDANNGVIPFGLLERKKRDDGQFATHSVGPFIGGGQLGEFKLPHKDGESRVSESRVMKGSKSEPVTITCIREETQQCSCSSSGTLHHIAFRD